MSTRLKFNRTSSDRDGTVGGPGPRPVPPSEAVVPASAPRHSRETIRTSAVERHESAVSPRGAARCPPISHVQQSDGQNRPQFDPQLPLDTQEQINQDHREQRLGKSRSASRDHGSLRSRESKKIKTRNEDLLCQHDLDYGYGGDRHANEQPNTSMGQSQHGVRYPSLKDNHRHSANNVFRSPSAHNKNAEPPGPLHASASTSLRDHVYEPQHQTQQPQSSTECLHTVLREKKALVDAYASLKYRYEDCTKKLGAIHHERQLALEQKKRADGAYAALRLQYEEQLTKLIATRHEHQSAVEQQQKVEVERDALKAKYDAQKGEYVVLSNRYQSLKAALEQRTLELQGVQRFHVSADAYSGAEVVNMLRNLNEEVQQNTAHMAEWSVEHFSFLETLRPDQLATEEIDQRTYETVGARLMRLLGTRKHKDNPILLEIAFRTYLIYSMYWVVSGEEEQSHSIYIDTIYQRMRETEGQAISGNWRALTRAYALPACISDSELAHTIDTTIIAGLSDILLAAGCTAPKEDVYSMLWTKFADKVHHFVSLAGHVSKAIGVGVISEDFEVLVVWPDAIFDDKQMEDSYDSGERIQGRDGPQEDVLCATDLGLMQQIKVDADAAAKKGKATELIVMKPKVALMSVLDIIDG